MKIKRVAIYLDEPEYRDVRAILAKDGVPFSEWVREMIHFKIQAQKKTAKGTK